MRNRKVKALAFLVSATITFSLGAISGQSTVQAKNAEVRPKVNQATKPVKAAKTSRFKFNPDALPVSSEAITVAIAAALTKEDAAYRASGNGPNAFDCSGLVLWSYAQAGVTLPHGSNNQIKVVKPITREELLPGDLVFSGRAGRGIQHVALYIGDGKVIHATYPTASRANQVRIDDLDSSWMMVHMAYGRVVQ